MKIVFISLILALLSLVAMGQGNVSNIRVQQMDNVLIIMYDLAEQANIEVFASFDGGVTYTDIRHSYYNRAWYHPNTSLNISGNPVELPSNMMPGHSIKDARTVAINHRGKVVYEINMIEGVCLTIEDVSVSAGTFKSHKITRTVIRNKSHRLQAVTWYAPGIGIVKTEVYSSGRLQTVTELLDIR